MPAIVNPKDVKALVATDKLFAAIKDVYGIPPNWSRPTGFVTLSRIILEQQVSLSSANAHFHKLNSYIKIFAPEELVKLSDEEMRACHISRQKTKYLRELSNAIMGKTLALDELHKLPADEVRQQLTAIKGIGHWTTDVYLMFCLHNKDIFPIGDIAAINTVKELTRAKTTEQILRRSAKWKPYRTLATFFLWHYYLNKRGRTIPAGMV